MMDALSAGSSMTIAASESSDSRFVGNASEAAAGGLSSAMPGYEIAREGESVWLQPQQDDAIIDGIATVAMSVAAVLKGVLWLPKTLCQRLGRWAKDGAKESAK